MAALETGSTHPIFCRRALVHHRIRSNNQLGVFSGIVHIENSCSHLILRSGAIASNPDPVAADEASNSPAYDVPPVTRAISLLRYIAAGNRCRNMSKAASALGINRTTLIRLLHTMEREQLIEQDIQGGGYILSYGVLELASNMLASRDIVRVSRPILNRLASRTSLSAHLGVLSGTDIIVLVRETPQVQLVSNIREGSRLPAYATVMGRMILSHMPRAAVEALFTGYPFAAITAQTPTTLDSLCLQLEQDHAAGLAWSVAYYENGIGSCAGVVLDQFGKPAGAISVSGPEAAFDESSDKRALIGEGVREAAQRLSTLMGHIG
jgi:DNA-binding IclR family transcriptional regulator